MRDFSERVVIRRPHRHVEAARLAGAAVELVCSRCGRVRTVPLTGPRWALPLDVVLVDSEALDLLRAALAVEQAFSEVAGDDG